MSGEDSTISRETVEEVNDLEWSSAIPNSDHIEKNVFKLCKKLPEYVKVVEKQLRKAKDRLKENEHQLYRYDVPPPPKQKRSHSPIPSSGSITRLVHSISSDFPIYVTNMTNKLNEDRQSYKDLAELNESLVELIKSMKEKYAADIEELEKMLESLESAIETEKTTILEDFGQQTEALDEEKDDKSAENPDLVDAVEDEMDVEVSLQSDVTSGNKKDDSVVSKASLGKTDECYDRFVEKMESAKECFEDLRRKCKESKQQIDQYEESLKYSEDHKKFLESQIEALNKQLSSTNSCHQLEMEAKNGVVKALEDRVQFLEQEMDKHTKKSVKLEEDQENYLLLLFTLLL